MVAKQLAALYPPIDVHISTALPDRTWLLQVDGQSGSATLLLCFSRLFLPTARLAWPRVLTAMDARAPIAATMGVGSGSTLAASSASSWLNAWDAASGGSSSSGGSGGAASALTEAFPLSGFYSHVPSGNAGTVLQLFSAVVGGRPDTAASARHLRLGGTGGANSGGPGSGADVIAQLALASPSGSGGGGGGGRGGEMETAAASAAGLLEASEQTLEVAVGVGRLNDLNASGSSWND